MSNIQLVHRTPIEKGWSGDRKYCAVDRAGKKYLLRVSAAEQYERKKLEFEQMRRVAALGIPMCEPLEFGRSEEGVYSIQSWIEGMDAKELIPTLEGSEQYAYGRTAGLLLQKIHSLPAPEGIVRWETRFRRKAERKMAYAAFRFCRIHRRWTNMTWKCGEQQASACCSQTIRCSLGLAETRISSRGTSSKAPRAYRLSTEGRLLPFCHL